MKKTVFILWLILGCSTFLLFGCASVGEEKSEDFADGRISGTVKEIAENTFIPKGVFPQIAAREKVAINFSNDLNEAEKQKTIGRALPLSVSVVIYESPSSKKFYKDTGLDFRINVRVWETFLQKYKFPYKTISSPEKIEVSTEGVLILPSLVSLSKREKQAILKFRARGGSVLSTWLTGVHDDSGTWQGFSFMKSGLDVDVVGDTQTDEEEHFMMAYGDSPVVHSLLAGQRIWIERLKGVYPLRLQGQQVAAQIMDWPRLAIGKKINSIVVFGEHRQSNGVLSRAVTFGYPERLWLSADPKAMEAIAHNTLTWLLRQPDARLAAWPHPYSNALSIAVDAPEVVDDYDLAFAKRVEEIGGKATYYSLSIKAVKSLTTLKVLQEKGHELAYMADQFEGFQGQTIDKQTSRINKMQQEFAQAGLSIRSTIGFHAPMESQDKITKEILNQQGFTYYVAFMDETEGRLPVLIPRMPNVAGITQPLVMLPRTQSGPEDLMVEGDPDEGLKKYLAEFDAALPMGGLLLVRFPNQTLLSEEQLDMIFHQMKANSKRLWFVPNGEVARWWLDRNRVKVQLDAVAGFPQLSVIISGNTPLQLPPSITVNLPYANDLLKLIPLENQQANVNMVALDPWRVAVSLGQLAPGTHRWKIDFERPSISKND